jgi:mannose/fructose-specific phosphotransferase system component IIA
MTSRAEDTAGIIITHGSLADKLLETANLVLGKVENLVPVNSGDLSDTAVVDRIKEIIAGSGSSRVVMFVDYCGGSCFNNCFRAVKGLENVVIISGVNLPVLLDFATKREIMDFDEMVDHLVKRGRDSINCERI